MNDENKTMPQMPGLPNAAPVQPTVSLEPKVPVAPVQPAVPLEPVLSPPEHVVEPPPVLNDLDNDAANKVELPVAPKGNEAIEVIAVREGFFNQHRKKEGDKFVVTSFKKLGEWMICVDPTLEKRRVQFFIDKKNKAKT